MSDNWSGWGASGTSPTDDESLGADVLERGRDRVSTLERVNGRLHTGEVSAFARRHPWRMSAACCLLVVAAGLTLYVINRPPPVDPVVQVSISGDFNEPQQRREPAPTDVLRADPILTGQYTVTTTVLGDVVEVQGVVGPGLAAPVPDAGPVIAQVGQPGYLGAANALDCTDSPWSSAADDDYRVRVIRTDLYDRVTQYDAPLGPSASRWRNAVRAQCLQRVLAGATVTSGTVDVADGRPLVVISLSIHNPSPFPVWLEAQGLNLGTTSAAEKVEADGQRELRLNAIVTDCPDGGTPLAEIYDDEGETLQATYVPLIADVKPLGPPPDPEGADDRWAAVPVTPDLAETIKRSMATVCRGFRPVSATVTRVHRLDGPAEPLRWALDVSLEVQADNVDFGFASLAPGSGIDGSLWNDPTLDFPGPATVHDGVARARLVWDVPSCNYVSETSPPWIYAVAIVGARRYATQLNLNDWPMLAALRAACSGAPSAEDALNYGWVDHDAGSQ